MNFVILVKQVMNTYVNRLKLGIYQDGGYSDLILVLNHNHLIKI